MEKYSTQQNTKQWTLGTQVLTPIGSKTSLGPSMNQQGPNNGPYFCLALCILFIHSPAPIKFLEFGFRNQDSKLGSREPHGPSLSKDWTPKWTPQWTIETSHGLSMDPTGHLKWTL